MLDSIGKRLEHFRGLFALKQGEFGEKIGLAPSSVSKLEAVNQPPSEAVLKVMEYAFLLNRDWLLKGEGDIFIRDSKFQAGDAARAVIHKEGSKASDRVREEVSAFDAGKFIMVPKYDVQAAAGDGVFIHSEQVVDHLAFKADWVINILKVKPQNLVLISARGDSMQPAIADGDLLAVDISKRDVDGDGIYCFRTDDSGLMIKRLQRLPDKVILVKSDNPAYQQFTVTPDYTGMFDVIGRVVWVGRKI